MKLSKARANTRNTVCGEVNTHSEKNNLLMRALKGRSGFTLLELIIVLAIIAALAVLILPNLANVRNKSDVIISKAELRNIHTTYTTDQAFTSDTLLPIDKVAFVKDDVMYKWDGTDNGEITSSTIGEIPNECNNHTGGVGASCTNVYYIAITPSSEIGADYSGYSLYEIVQCGETVEDNGG